MPGSPPKDDKKVTRLKIETCTVGYSGVTKNERKEPFTIYEITAHRMDGSKVQETLRSFEDLPLGEPVELTVTPFPSEKYGMSYTLALKNKVGNTQRLNELQAQVADLSERLQRVEAWARSTSARASGVTPEAATAPGGADTRVPEQVAHEEHLATAAQDRQVDLNTRFGAEAPY
jgi:hypothetical protein